jgi:hypothetical protein
MASMDFVSFPNGLPVNNDFQSFLQTHSSPLHFAYAGPTEIAINRELLDELSKIDPRVQPTAIKVIVARVQNILIDCRNTAGERNVREPRCLSPESSLWSIDYLLERVPLELWPIPSPTACFSPFCDGDEELYDHSNAHQHASEDGILCSAPCAAAAGLLGLGVLVGTLDRYLCPFIDCTECCDGRGSLNTHISSCHDGFESFLCDTLGHFWGSMVAIRTKLGR